MIKRWRAIVLVSAFVLLTMALLFRQPTHPTQRYGPQPDTTCKKGDGSIFIDMGDDIAAVVASHHSGTRFCVGYGMHVVAESVRLKSDDTFQCEYGAEIHRNQWAVEPLFSALLSAGGITIRNCTFVGVLEWTVIGSAIPMPR